MIHLILLMKKLLNSLARTERSSVGGSGSSFSLPRSLFVSLKVSL